MEHLRMKVSFFVAALLALTFQVSCTFKKAELGSSDNPIKLFFVPSVDARVIDSNSKIMKTWLEKNTPYKYEIFTPQNFIAVVEAFGAKRADVCAMNTFGYLLAHEKYGAEARLIVMRKGRPTYQSQIIAKKDRFKDLKSLEGAKFAFVDPASLSGYILPLKYLTDQGVKLGDTVFAHGHDKVVSMIYQGQVDAGATFYSPPDEKEGILDARYLVKTQYPDVEKKIEIVKLTHEIPNDPIVFRKDMPEEIKVKLTEAFLKMSADPEGIKALTNIYSATAIQAATDKDYDGIREMMKTVKVDAAEVLKKKK